MTLTPAYGRDYKSKKAVQVDFDDGKDFVVADIFGGQAGRYCNRTDLLAQGVTSVTVRYAQLRKVCVLNVKA